jgi:hypothetical protein
MTGPPAARLSEQSPGTAGQMAGVWVTERVYSELHSISRQTLSNWRYRDKAAGRSGAALGFPVYRRFGRAIRYWLPNDAQPAGGDNKGTAA